MNTHNIGFYEEISRIITLLSSNIIKYGPLFFLLGVQISSNMHLISSAVYLYVLVGLFLHGLRTLSMKNRDFCVKM